MRDRDRLIHIIKAKGDCKDRHFCELTSDEDCPLFRTACMHFSKDTEISKQTYDFALEIYVDKFGEGSLVEDLI